MPERLPETLTIEDLLSDCVPRAALRALNLPPLGASPSPAAAAVAQSASPAATVVAPATSSPTTRTTPAASPPPAAVSPTRTASGSVSPVATTPSVPPAPVAATPAPPTIAPAKPPAATVVSVVAASAPSIGLLAQISEWRDSESQSVPIEQLSGARETSPVKLADVTLRYQRNALRSALDLQATAQNCLGLPVVIEEMTWVLHSPQNVPIAMGVCVDRTMPFRRSMELFGRLALDFHPLAPGSEIELLTTVTYPWEAVLAELELDPSELPVEPFARTRWPVGSRAASSEAADVEVVLWAEAQPDIKLEAIISLTEQFTAASERRSLALVLRNSAQQVVAQDTRSHDSPGMSQPRGLTRSIELDSVGLRAIRSLALALRAERVVVAEPVWRCRVGAFEGVAS